MTNSNLGDGETTGPFIASNGIIDVVLNLVDNQFYVITLWDETEGATSNTVSVEFSKYILRVDMFHSSVQFVFVDNLVKSPTNDMFYE